MGLEKIPRRGLHCGIPPLRLRSGQALAQKAAQDGAPGVILAALKWPTRKPFLRAFFLKCNAVRVLTFDAGGTTVDATFLQTATLTQVTTAITAVGALGAAAFGLVDSSKVLPGLIPSSGFGFIRKLVMQLAPASGSVD